MLQFPRYRTVSELRYGSTYQVEQGKKSFVLKMVRKCPETTAITTQILELERRGSEKNNKGHKYIVQLLRPPDKKEVVCTTTGLSGMDCRLFEHCQYSFEEVKSDLNRKIPNFNKLEGITQACVGLDFLHKNGYIHGNLKPSNIMFCKIGGEWTVKLADFKVVVSGSGSYVEANTPPDTCYRAPETWPIHRETVYYRKTADTWSLGCFAYELYTETPYVTLIDPVRKTIIPDWKDYQSKNENEFKQLLRDKKEKLETSINGDFPILQCDRDLRRHIKEWKSTNTNALLEEHGVEYDRTVNYSIETALRMVTTAMIQGMLRANPNDHILNENQNHQQVIKRPSCNEIMWSLWKFKDLKDIVSNCHPKKSKAICEDSILRIITKPFSTIFTLKVSKAESTLTTWHQMVNGTCGELELVFESLQFDGFDLRFYLKRRMRNDPPANNDTRDVNNSAVNVAPPGLSAPASDLRVQAMYASDGKEVTVQIDMMLVLKYKCNNKVEDMICGDTSYVHHLRAKESKTILICEIPKPADRFSFDRNEEDEYLPRLIVSLI